MLTGRRYLLAFTPEQEEFAEFVGDARRMVWNTALEQRRAYRHRGVFIGYVEQARQMAEAKKDFAWLAEAPSHTLQQTLRDLDKACKTHGTFKVRWRSKRKSAPTFRFPDPEHVAVERLSRRWGHVKLPKLGWVKFRWTRAVGEFRNTTVLKDGGRWYISFCVEDGVMESAPNGKHPVGVDRGVVVAVATSDGWMRDREFVTPGEAARSKRLQQQLARQKKGSNRRAATKAKLGKLNARIRNRRTDFLAWTANRLTWDHGLVVVEDLKVCNMTRTAKGTIEAPGKNVRQKAGLNRAILAKGWGGLLTALKHKARYCGSRIVRVPAAYTSQRCSACGVVDAKSREHSRRRAGGDRAWRPRHWAVYEAPTTRDRGRVNAPQPRESPGFSHGEEVNHAYRGSGRAVGAAAGDRADLDLTLGRHEVTLVELTPVVDETPPWWDERRLLGLEPGPGGEGR